MKVLPGRVVSLVYQMTGEDGTRFDHAYSDAPLRYLHGHQHLAAGLESRLEGLYPQETIDEELSSAELFGPPEEEDPVFVSKESFEEVADPRPGGGLLGTVDGVERPLWIRAVHSDGIEADLAHPRSGGRVRVHILVFGVRLASAEELASGRPRVIE